MAIFRVEKTKDFTVMSNHHLRNTGLSLKAKGLLSLMLSLPEGWDYTTKGLAHICRDGVDSISTALRELEWCGYLTRHRLRRENGQLGDIEYTIHEKPAFDEENDAPPDLPTPKQENPVQAKPVQGKHEQLNTNQSNTEESSIYQSIYPDKPQTKGRDAAIGDSDDKFQAAQHTAAKEDIFQAAQCLITSADKFPTEQCPAASGNAEIARSYRELLKENIEYDVLCSRYGEQRVDGIVDLMLETMLSRRPTIRIAGDDFPRTIVGSRFLKLRADHIEYVFDCLDRNTTKISNIKAYLLAALYNAPATMDSYYRAEVNHDLYGGQTPDAAVSQTNHR